MICVNWRDIKSRDGIIRANVCRYGCVMVSGVVVVEVDMTSSIIWVRDGGGGV